MSGPLVLSLAQNMPDKVGGVASIHGAWLVTDKDNSPHKNLDSIEAEVYFGWADNDPTATPEELKIMTAELDSAGVNYRLDFFEDAVHGYAPAGEPTAQPGWYPLPYTYGWTYSTPPSTALRSAPAGARKPSPTFFT